MADPRIFQGSPLTEVPLEWARKRDGGDDVIGCSRSKATQIAPGVFVLVLAWGDMLGPDGRVTRGARIAVWAGEPTITEGEPAP